MSGRAGGIARELRHHVPFTLFGAVTGVLIAAGMVVLRAPHELSHDLFKVFHPLHVFFSALVTAGLYKRNGKGTAWKLLLIGYFGAVGIGTLSDCLIPYLGELLLGFENAHLHLGFIEHPFLVNGLALGGVVVAWRWPKTKAPHAGHVLLSTWASLFHMTMALGDGLSLLTAILMVLVLFVAVWVPCCFSDIVFPMLFVGGPVRHEHEGGKEEPAD
jgi:hypothetical protein